MFDYCRKIKFHRGKIILLLRCFLGFLFIYASFDKIINIDDFRINISRYELIDFKIVNLFALILPWIEFISGIFLCTGLFVRSCAFIQFCLLISFIIAIEINIKRNVNFDCGCFGNEILFTGINHIHVFFNLFCALLCLLLIYLERRRFSHRFFNISSSGQKSES